jgi:hypothetical protein
MHTGADICLIDCDTLLLRPISQFFDDEFDVLFTWKDRGSGIPYSGVLLLKNNVGAQKFIEEWVKETEALANDPKKLFEACKTSGGGDQHTLRLILNTTEERIERRMVDVSDIQRCSWESS